MQLKYMTKKAKRLFKTQKSFPHIYLLGNSSIKEDSFPLKLLPFLSSAFQNISFIPLDPTENFPQESHLIIIDTLANANKILIIKDLAQIQPSPNYSLHDFDLKFQLSLLKKLNLLKDFTIIGIPNNLSQEQALKELKEIIASLNP